MYEDLNQKYHFTKQELQLIFESIPANIFFKDTQGRYQLSSHVCDMISGGSEDFTLIGKTDCDIMPDKKLGKRYLEEDLEVAATGKTFHYIQEMEFSGEFYYYEISKYPVYDEDQKIIGLTGFIYDITEMVKLQKKTKMYSITDSMTGIYNRTYYEEHEQTIKKEHIPMAVIMADCDGLKYVNDHYGHRDGDYLITSTVSNIVRFLKDEAEMVRIGGDEFLILIPNCTQEECEKLLNDIKKSETNIYVNERKLSTSYGYVIANDTEKTIDELVEIADKRMYREKKHKIIHRG